ncbi:Transcriptional regulator, contains XRE-family HTH domain [Nonomuraea maritima]|uniref:Transcriptional regulator, contains XRE-family HTH domain n=1 Tax=Nonomuraea maritima TaxID=683260 RepID=A0A1G8ZI68_9ACTN|nr:helix-turn-helix domain-containing protein [Nonomuraea maritima]SDK14284.1 Transcriptional regulator, contains XRE-family HTH domain [Nonomuraea maritima]
MSGHGSSLARRLRELREERWPDLRITQAQLSVALGVSVPLISSWESDRATKIPPMVRLEKYAAFFATRRSFTDDTTRTLPLSDLTPEELDEYHALLKELAELRKAALRVQALGESAPPAPARNAYAESPWHFPAGEAITIICSQIPAENRVRIPQADPAHPDYIDLYRYSDLDSLFELWGHLRAANPHSPVALRAAEDLRSSDDVTSHVVLLGGVDYNEVTAAMLAQIDLPVRQVADWEGERGPYFEVGSGDNTVPHYTRFNRSGDNLQLLEDVGFFYRGVNPENIKRTLTICNGVYARGVYGTVRALTDERFRDRNADYLRGRFGDAASYSILTRVKILGRLAITPDWTRENLRLHEWPEDAHGD